MIGNLGVTLLPVGIALGIVGTFVVVPILVGRAIGNAERQEPRRTFDPFAEVDLTDDGADTKRSPATEAAERQALAIVNDGPDPAFIARTRTRVMDEVDELARRRAVSR